MRRRPEVITRPLEGCSKLENRLSSVVLPHPDGPTMATNSPRSISSEMSRNTSTAPKDFETPSSLSGLSLIPPPHARNPGQLHENSIDDYPDGADHDHPRDEQIHAQAVARVPDREAQPIAARDHLGGDDDNPRQPGRHPQSRDHLRQDGRQRHLPEQFRAADAIIAGDAKMD